LAAEVPISSGISPAFLHSPLAALGTFERHSNNPETPLSDEPGAPAWAHMIPKFCLQFRQPRGAIAEVFRALAYWYDNNIMVCYLLLRMLFSSDRYHPGFIVPGNYTVGGVYRSLFMVYL
jgi:hypothetical protein